MRQFSNRLDKPYDIGCELERKRVECACGSGQSNPVRNNPVKERKILCGKEVWH